MATSGLSVVSEENQNYFRLCKLLVEGGAKVLRGVFDTIVPPRSLRGHLQDPKNYGILKNLQSKRILNQEQWDMLYPSGGSTADSQNFDITLLSLLLRNVCNLTPPSGGWSNPPASTCTMIPDDIVRIRLYRNQIAHIEEPALSDPEFSKYWNDITIVLLRLGGKHYQTEIDELKVALMDPAEEKYYIQCLKEWESEERRIMKALDEMKQELTQTKQELGEKINKVNDTVDGATSEVIDKVIESEHRIIGEIQGIGKAQATNVPHAGSLNTEDAEVFSRTLKEAVNNKVQTVDDFAVSTILENKRLEDIFTQLIIHHTPKEKSSQPQTPREFESSKKIHSIQELFLDKSQKNSPKSILITGNAGVGKSLFSRKLLADWSKDCIFNEERADNPEIRFAFLITFRQLNMLDEKMSLVQFLNEFSVLDKSMDDSVMDYIIEHPQQVLLIVDGYDEYRSQLRQQLNNENFDSSFPDNPRSKMPAAALVRKLVKGKLLANSVIILTSRPGEASEMKNLNFDRYLEIVGYSKKQFEEYVKKYFQYDEEKQKNALKTIHEKQHVLGSGRVPLMALLICVYLDFNMSNNSQCFPQTLTQFYSEIVDCIEKNYNKAMKKDNLDAKTLYEKTDMIKDKMSELAAKTILDGKFTFSEEDLSQLQLSEVDRTYLQCSSLLFCECSSGKKSAYSSEVVRQYSFCHTTFHEFLAARHFVTKMRKIPQKIKLTAMTLQFMAGSMVVGKDERLMEQLLGYIDDKLEGEDEQRASLSLTCLHEYGDENLSKKVVKKNKNHRYWNRKGEIRLSNIDSNVVVMFLDIVNTLNPNKFLSFFSPVPHFLYIRSSHFTVFTTQQLLEALTNTSCTVTELWLHGCKIDDECCLWVSRYLRRTKLTCLTLWYNPLTERDVDMLLDGCCQGLKVLGLDGTNITNKQHVKGLFEKKYPGLVLYIW